MKDILRAPLSMIAALIVLYISVHLELAYVGFAVLLGVSFTLLSLFLSDDLLTSIASSYVCAFIGLAILLVAYLICSSYGISFEALNQDRSIPRLIRRLPYFGITLISAGMTNFVISIVKRNMP